MYAVRAKSRYSSGASALAVPMLPSGSASGLNAVESTLHVEGGNGAEMRVFDVSFGRDGTKVSQAPLRLFSVSKSADILSEIRETVARRP